MRIKKPSNTFEETMQKKVQPARKKLQLVKEIYVSVVVDKRENINLIMNHRP